MFEPLNVNDLLAKKLNINADDVDMKLLAITGSPNATKTNNITKSIAVFNPPTIAKRNLSACFLIRFFMMVFLYEIKWAHFCFVKDSTYIFANNSERQNNSAPQEKH